MLQFFLHAGLWHPEFSDQLKKKNNNKKRSYE